VKVDPDVWGTVFPELLETPDLKRTRPILGFRVNRMQIIRDEHRPFGLVLTSLGTSGYFWEPGRNIAGCSRPGTGFLNMGIHRAPAAGCTCGLYACHDLAGVHWPSAGAGGFVLAAVAGTGIVRIHERGWRAQFARIVALSTERPELTGGRGHKVIGSKVARALEQKYEVPVVPLKKLAQVMRGVGDFLEGQP
jgi:hypothetical protein